MPQPVAAELDPVLGHLVRHLPRQTSHDAGVASDAGADLLPAQRAPAVDQRRQDEHECGHRVRAQEREGVLEVVPVAVVEREKDPCALRPALILDPRRRAVATPPQEP